MVIPPPVLWSKKSEWKNFLKTKILNVKIYLLACPPRLPQYSRLLYPPRPPFSRFSSIDLLADRSDSSSVLHRSDNCRFFLAVDLSFTILIGSLFILVVTSSRSLSLSFCASSIMIESFLEIEDLDVW